MEEMRKALYQYAVIAEDIANVYKDDSTSEDIQRDHPELNFMDEEEIQDLLEVARHQRQKSPEERTRMLEMFKNL